MTVKLSLVYRRRATITAMEFNPRTHSAKQVEQIVASIKEFGFTNPILIDEYDEIIAGHGRMKAAEVLNLEEVPTIRLRGLTPEQRKAYVIADNKLALNSGWDSELLALDMESLMTAEFDLALTGFDDEELVPYTGIVNGEEFPELSSADRVAFQRMAFVLHDDQVELVKSAIRKSKDQADVATPNTNRNGNALARICFYYLEKNGYPQNEKA